MSTTYQVYAEVKHNGKWCNLNPITKNNKGEYGLIPIYWSGSGMWDVYCDLEDYAILRGVPEDMCSELREKFPENLNEKFEGWTEDYTYRKYYDTMMFAVRFDTALANRVKKDRPYKYRGYIQRETQASFECGEIEDIGGWITIEEYNSLSEKAREGFVYYEWNNTWDDYRIYTSIVTKIRNLLSWFIDSHSAWDEIGDSDIRVFIYKS